MGRQRVIAEEVKACCAAAYGDEAVRWLVGESLHPGGLALTDQLLTPLNLSAESTLLDVACGTGASGRRAFERFGCSLVGTDLSVEMVREAGATSPSERVRFIVADAEELPLADDSVDAVLCECALCLFPDPHRALAEAARVLRQGGRIVVADMTANPHQLPESLHGLAGRIACLGAARPLADMASRVATAGFSLHGVHDASAGLDELLGRIEDRVSLARMLRAGLPESMRTRLDEAEVLLADARTARRGLRVRDRAQTGADRASIRPRVASNAA